MSDLDRNYSSPFGRAAGRTDAAAVDAGLRAYMLRIYNYMSIGLAITGLAALGVYMAATTGDASGASWRSFRYPYLRQGFDAASTSAVREFLDARGYQIAEVSIDFWDWAYQEPYVRCVEAGAEV